MKHITVNMQYTAADLSFLRETAVWQDMLCASAGHPPAEYVYKHYSLSFVSVSEKYPGRSAENSMYSPVDG